MKKLFTLFAAALTAISASATFYAFNGTSLTESMVLVNDEYAEVYVGNLPEEAVSNVFEIADYEAFYTPVNCALAPSERTNPTRTLTFCDHQFEYAAYVRTESNPTQAAPEGAYVNKADDMGRGEINCVTILVEPKENCMISFYYMRGATKTFNCFDSYAGTALNHASDSLMYQETITNCDGNVTNNEFHLTTFELQKDHVYTFYTRGGTTQLFGFETVVNEVVTPYMEFTVTSESNLAPDFNEMENGSILLKGTTIEDKGAGAALKLDSENKYVAVSFDKTIAAGALIEVAFHAGSNPSVANKDGIRLLDDKATASGVQTLASKYLDPADKKNLVTLEYTTTEAMDEFYIYLIVNSSSMYFRSVKVYGEEEKATGIFNSAAAVKAVKTIENGQIVIIRDGKKFNAVGVEL